jgi:hypothetical protein
MNKQKARERIYKQDKTYYKSFFVFDFNHSTPPEILKIKYQPPTHSDTWARNTRTRPKQRPLTTCAKMGA